MAKALSSLILVVGGVGIVIWASDRITLEGERTIYTVVCDEGTWEDLRCTGRLAAGDLHRFRASRTRNEVIFWVAGSHTPSGKYSDCRVTDRDNWACKVDVGGQTAIVHELSRGRPPATGPGPIISFHAVSKWKWWILRAGFPRLRQADYRNGFNQLPPAGARTD